MAGHPSGGKNPGDVRKGKPKVRKKPPPRLVDPIRAPGGKPIPSAPKLPTKNPRAPAPKPDVTLGGDEHPKRSGHKKPPKPKGVGRVIQRTARRERKRIKTEQRRKAIKNFRSGKYGDISEAGAKAIVYGSEAGRRKVSRDDKLTAMRKPQTKILGTGVTLNSVKRAVGKKSAPAITILDQFTRPYEVVSGGINREVKMIKKGKPAEVLNLPATVKAGYESGVTRKHQTTLGDVADTLGVDKVARDVLKKAGAKKKTQETAARTATEGIGLAASAVADPTNLIPGKAGLGATATAVRAAKRAAEAKRVAEAAKIEAKVVGRRVAARTPKERKAARRAVSQASRQRFTEAGGRARKRGQRDKGDKPTRLGTTLRKAIPLKPYGLTDAEWQVMKANDVGRRGRELHETRRTARKGRKVTRAAGGRVNRVIPERKGPGGKRRFGPGRKKAAEAQVSQKIRDAIEARDLSKLTPNERAAAKTLHAEQERIYHARREAARDAGQRPPTRYEARNADEPEGYVHRQSMAAMDPKQRRYLKRSGQQVTENFPARKGTGKASARTTTLKDQMRTERRPMKEVREDVPTAYVDDLETTLRSKGQKDWQRVSHDIYRTKTKALGRKVKGENPKWDPQTEGIYTVKDGRLAPVDKGGFVPGKPDDFVILKHAIANHANEAMTATGHIPFLDNVTSKIKWVLTIPNPQYWSRNAYGGLLNAFQEGVPGRNMPSAIRQAWKVNGEISRRMRNEEGWSKPRRLKLKQTGTREVEGVARTKGDRRPMATRTGKGFNPNRGRKLSSPRLDAPEPKAPRHIRELGERELPVGPGKQKVKVSEFIRELERVHVSGGGQTQELIGAQFQRRMKAQAMEDLPRLTAYIHYRRKGLSPEVAAKRSHASQFDYGDLTLVERQWARRIMPFYTWRSRNVVLQAKTLYQRPGKMSAIERSRDAAAEAAGFPDDYQDQLSQQERLGVPIATHFMANLPLIGKRKILTYAGLPVNDLNLFSSNPSEVAQQLMSSNHPGFKAVLEFATNHSFFFRDQIEGPGQKYTAAPSKLIKRLPDEVRKDLVKAKILQKGYDRWTGRYTWQWRAKADYGAKLSPFTGTLFAAATSGRTKKGQNFFTKAIGFGTGIRPMPFVPESTQLFESYDKRDKIQNRIDDLYELRTYKKEKAKEYAKLRTEKVAYDWIIYDLEGKLGKKDRTEPSSKRGSTYTAAEIKKNIAESEGSSSSSSSSKVKPKIVQPAP